MREWAPPLETGAAPRPETDDPVPGSERTGPPRRGRSEKGHHRGAHGRSRSEEAGVGGDHAPSPFIQGRQLLQGGSTRQVECGPTHSGLNIRDHLNIPGSPGKDHPKTVRLNQSIRQLGKPVISPQLAFPLSHRVEGDIKIFSCPVRILCRIRGFGTAQQLRYRLSVLIRHRKVIDDFLYRNAGGLHQHQVSLEGVVFHTHRRYRSIQEKIALLHVLHPLSEADLSIPPGQARQHSAFEELLKIEHQIVPGIPKVADKPGHFQKAPPPVRPPKAAYPAFAF